MIKIGLIINPIAGMGGSVGLKGTDGEEIVEKAISLGAKPKSSIKAIIALEQIENLKEDIKIVTGPKDMGENEAKKLGFNVEVIDIKNYRKNGIDTVNICKEMLKKNIEIILFVGGDGTARDVYEGVGDKTITLGIPSGVKIHSPVYAINPKSAGVVAYKYITQKIKSTIMREVVDLDETMYREGRVNTKLYGYLRVPLDNEAIQNKKAPTPLSEECAQKSIGLFIADNMEKDTIYIIGPGTTTKAILDTLNLESTLLGVDIIKNKKIIKLDANEADILKFIRGNKTKLIITPTGGQGYLLGRGNQQISYKVIKEINKENILVVSTLYKIKSLKFKPLYIDTSNEEVDNMLSGYIKVIIGYKDEIMYKVKN
ncbi:ATP-NAD kinase family protein [Paraclostridium bifermentans]|uniref:ATP-NAD kinase family protein n=1 Tax=Paraclostridium bifermentans TaxID=1490 RepID=UPI00359C81D8